MGALAKTQNLKCLLKVLSKVGFDKIEQYDAADSRVPSGKRINVVAYMNGKPDAKRLWIVAHLDVVPPGEESLWKITKPFEPKEKGGCIYGRGSEDNGQSLVSAIFAAKALKQLGIKLNRTLALAFVSDEEQGSTIGIQYLLKQGIFRKDDLVMVPDHGTPKGDFIEIAEKSILWFKLTTIGKQSHGSLPNKGLNAHRIGMQVALELDQKLHQKYKATNDYFDVPTSTFEPTKKDKNVDSINIVPGEDTVYFDCRILPNYKVDEVLSDIRKVTSDFEKKTGAKIQLEVLQKQSSPQNLTKDSEIVVLLNKALKQARGFEAQVGGVGGGTCAAFFREAGIPAIVWSTIDEVPHQPDEYARIANMVEDAKVFAILSRDVAFSLDPPRFFFPRQKCFKGALSVNARIPLTELTNLNKTDKIICQAQSEGRKALLEPEAKTICAEYGIAVNNFIVAKSAEEAAKAAEKIGYPVVMKIVSQDIIHKSDAGGVKVNIKTKEEVKTAYNTILENAHKYKADARIAGILVQEMAPQGTEVIVGAIKDPQFGQTVMFGLGGIFVEILKDVTFKVAPITEAEAADMIVGVRAYPLLNGYRNTPPSDVKAIVNVLMSVSKLVVDHPEIKELDLNPVMAYEKGTKTVDARIILE